MALVLAIALAGCGPGEEAQAASVCESTGELLRQMARGLTEDLDEESLATAVDRVAAEAESTEDQELREPARRLEAAWASRHGDGEAAPPEDFGRAADDLAQACVRRGFTFPDVGSD